MLIQPWFSPETVEMARAALNALDARAGENLDEWARRLGSDIAAPQHIVLFKTRAVGPTQIFPRIVSID